MDNQQGTKVNTNYVVMEYKEAVRSLTDENIVLKAFVKQLQAEIVMLQNKSGKVNEDSPISEM